MSIFKRGRTYWFHFWFDGRHVQRSTRQGNPRVARQIESAYRTQLAKGEVGIEDRKHAPTLRNFRQQFLEEIGVKCAPKPGTIEFYTYKFDALLNFEPLANSRLDHIDEALIARFVQWRSKDAKPATINRCLATLRRALRMAAKWKIIKRAPQVELLPGEHAREFVLGRKLEPHYLQASPEPLRSVATLILDTGLRVGEALNLKWADVHLEPVGDASRGYIHISNGKSRTAKRNVSLTARAASLLRNLQENALSEFVFVRHDKLSPVSRFTLDDQHKKVREALKLSSEFVIHSLRHSMLTRLGEAGVDAFTIMRIAGHSTLAVSQRYVHPTPETLERAIDQLEAGNVKDSKSERRLPLATVSATVRGLQPNALQ
jgi:integrase